MQDSLSPCFRPGPYSLRQGATPGGRVGGAFGGGARVLKWQI